MEGSDSKELLYDFSSAGGPVDVNRDIVEDIPVSLDVSSIDLPSKLTLVGR